MSNAAGDKQGGMEWLGLEAPRYTSYPSAHHFLPKIGESQHIEWLNAIGEQSSVSAYLHIPFCRELCWFCGCHTKMTKRYDPIEKYVRVLLKEIENLKQHVRGKGILKNIHFGGGSPSLLERGDLMAILYALSSTFDFKEGGELAIELDPRTTTPENIARYADLGFNRVSIGIQDFDPVVQQAINRIQSYDMVASVLANLRQAGLQKINCDLIYGLPHQTMERFRETLLKTIGLAPSRIALFSYAHVPQVKKHQRMIDEAWLPSDAEKIELYVMACELLAENGYVAIGIDHFAQKNDPLAVAMQNRTLRRNFQGYVTEATEVLVGFGSSAISQFPQGYVQNTVQSVDYRNRVESGSLPSVRGWAFEGDDPVCKRVIDDLMCFLSVDLAEIRQAFGLDEHYFKAELEELREDRYRNIINCDGDSVRMTTPYRMATRVVASIFDRYRGTANGRYSKVA